MIVLIINQSVGKQLHLVAALLNCWFWRFYFLFMVLLLFLVMVLILALVCGSGSDYVLVSGSDYGL